MASVSPWRGERLLATKLSCPAAACFEHPQPLVPNWGRQRGSEPWATQNRCWLEASWEPPYPCGSRGRELVPDRPCREGCGCRSFCSACSF